MNKWIKYLSDQNRIKLELSNEKLYKNPTKYLDIKQYTSR